LLALHFYQTRIFEIFLCTFSNITAIFFR